MGLSTSVELISIVDGVRRDNKKAGEIAVVQPGGLFGLGREAGKLLILTDPPSGFASDANRLVVQSLASAYLRESSGSVTSRLARALREGNRSLCQENSNTVSSQRQYLSALCAVVTPREAYFAQVGPSIIIRVRDGQLERLGERASSILSSSSIGRDFGFEVHYAHTLLDPGDIIILSSPGLASITNRNELLLCLAEPGPQSLSDRLFQLYADSSTQADLSAIVVELRGSRAKEPTQPRPKHPRRDEEVKVPATPNFSGPFERARFDERTSSAEIAGNRANLKPKRNPDPQHQDSRAMRVLSSLREERASSTLRVDASVNTSRSSNELAPYPNRQAPLEISQPDPPRPGRPSRSSRATQSEPPLPISDVVIEFKGSKVDTGAINVAAASMIRADAIGDRAAIVAQESVLTLLNYLDWAKRILIALLIPIAVGTILVALGFLFLRGYQIQAGEQQPSRPTLEESLQLERDALATTDPSLKRRMLAQADKMVFSAVASHPEDREAANSATRIRSELDKLNGISRLTGAEVLVDLSREPGSSDSLNMTMQGIDIYLLDRDAGRVYKYLLNETGNAIQQIGSPLLMRKGDTFGGAAVGNLVAMAWISPGGARTRGVLAALDSSGTVFEYDPTKGIAALPIGNSDSLTGHLAVAGHAGNLYGLDSQKGKLFWYPPPQGSYGDRVYNYFNPDTTVDLSTAVDFAIDGSVYLLQSNGRVEKFFMGRPQPFDTVLPDSPLKAPTSIFSSPDSRYVYIVDAGNSRVVQLTKEGAFERQIQFKGSDDVLRGAKRISVDEKRGLLYVLNGKKVLSLNLEKQ